MNKLNKRYLILALVVLVVAGIGLSVWRKYDRKMQDERFKEERTNAVVQAVEAAAEICFLDDIALQKAAFNEDTGLLEFEFDSEKFSELSHEAKYAFFREIIKAESYYELYGVQSYITTGRLIIQSQGAEYKLDGKLLFENKEIVYKDPTLNKDSSDGKSCGACNGTGSVKYYYGGSSTEAMLNGHEDSWYGQCGSCGGTGKK